MRNRNEKDDDDAPDEDIYSLTVSDRTELGTLVIPRVRTSTLTISTASPGVEEEESKVTYKRRSSSGQYDTMDFEFGIEDLSAVEVNYDKVYALVTFMSIPIGGTGVTLESRETKTTIFPSNPSAYTDVVGDGKFIKLDREPPGDNLFEFGAVTIVTGKGEPKSGAAFINRHIRTEAKLKVVL